jgi:hypothetical protein
MIERDSRLAWRLADELTAGLTEPDKTAVYVELGAGDIWPAITRMLTIAVHTDLALPADLINEFAVWLDKYVGGIEEPLIRDLLMRAPSSPTGGTTAGPDRPRGTGTTG